MVYSELESPIWIQATLYGPVPLKFSEVQVPLSITFCPLLLLLAGIHTGTWGTGAGLCPEHMTDSLIS